MNVPRPEACPHPYSDQFLRRGLSNETFPVDTECGAAIPARRCLGTLVGGSAGDALVFTPIITSRAQDAAQTPPRRRHPLLGAVASPGALFHADGPPRGHMRAGTATTTAYLLASSGGTRAQSPVPDGAAGDDDDTIEFKFKASDSYNVLPTGSLSPKRKRDSASATARKLVLAPASWQATTSGPTNKRLHGARRGARPTSSPLTVPESAPASWTARQKAAGSKPKARPKSKARSKSKPRKQRQRSRKTRSRKRRGSRTTQAATEGQALAAAHVAPTPRRAEWMCVGASFCKQGATRVFRPCNSVGVKAIDPAFMRLGESRCPHGPKRLCETHFRFLMRCRTDTDAQGHSRCADELPDGSRCREVLEAFHLQGCVIPRRLTGDEGRRARKYTPANDDAGSGGGSSSGGHVSGRVGAGSSDATSRSAGHGATSGSSTGSGGSAGGSGGGGSVGKCAPPDAACQEVALPPTSISTEDLLPIPAPALVRSSSCESASGRASPTKKPRTG